MLLRDVVLKTSLKAGGDSAPQLAAAKEATLSEKLLEFGCSSHKATPLATKVGKEVKSLYRKKSS